MKILKIELQNINSLTSELPIVIDFEKAIFQDVGLYAITGATGAGKTTILDAITIALYHQVPRFKKSNSKGSLRDIVSYGAQKAMARVTFANHSHRYEALWSMRLIGKNGKPLTKPDEGVRLKELDTEKIIAEKKQEFRSAILNITQLTYEQFLRSVMLAQGEFAAFLSASASEKGTLLEQITGEEIYKRIGDAIVARRGEENKKLEKIQARINTEDLLSIEKYDALTQENNTLEKDLLALTPEAKKLEVILQWYTTNEQLNAQGKILSEKEISLFEIAKQQEPILQRLKIHEQAAPFKVQLENVTRLEKELGEKRQEYAALKKTVTDLENSYTTLKEQHTQANSTAQLAEKEQTMWLPKLEQITTLDTEIKNNTKQEKELQQLLTNSLLEKETIEKQRKTIHLQHDSLHKEIKTGTTFLQKHQSVLNYEKEISNWSALLQVRKKEIEQIQEEDFQIAKKQEELNRKNKQLLEISKRVTEKQQNLNTRQEEIEIQETQLKANNIDHLLTRQKQQLQAQDNYKTLERIATEYTVVNTQRTTLETTIKTLTSQVTQHKEQLTVLTPKLEKSATTVIDKEKIFTLETKISSFEEEREKLVKDDACPLCGATTHPLIQEYKNINISLAKQELDASKTAHKALDHEIKQLELSLVKLTTTLHNNTTQLKEITAKIEEYILDFNKISAPFKINDIEQIQQAIHDNTSLISATDQQIITTQQLQKSRDLNLKILTSETNNIKEHVQEQLILIEQNKALEIELQERSEKKDQTTERIQAKTLELQEDLAAYQLQLPQNIEDTSIFIRKLEENVAHYYQQEKEITQLENDISKLDLTIKNLDEQYLEKKGIAQEKSKIVQQLQQQNNDLIKQRVAILAKNISTEQKRISLQERITTTKEIAEKINEQFVTLEKEKAAKTELKSRLQTEGTTAKETLDHAQKELSIALESSELKTLENLKNILLSPEEETLFIAKRRKIEDDQLEFTTQKEQWNLNFKKQEALKDFEISHVDAKEQFQSIDHRKNELLKRSGAIKKQFELDQQIKDRNQSVVKEIDVQDRVVLKWSRLLQVIGGSKDAFNTYVQRLTLQNLIHLANLHLYKLNKRYSLQMNEVYKKGEELNFVLTDHYQADESRLVDTCSGGEKFLISLSLALGLSDLSSNHVSIGSLFIDEGFGTLDTNTLETVIATLETLQAQGKMIGIISHVENLKERIPTQIKVIKKNNGVSEVLIS